ncbi:hypothetical protein PHYBLDRAFT_65588 [Phycomyces blakesleeanus NRRL 1555(-)]|uniref:Uncharacterized protein n=1 Tax=Phycomyces blakesleeanus (strain ATCC 8743b / DSM 1359 / FGSC 10004 / NBRC 33097 / NRRL 1555) TaxID=763407 RepID=A0A162PS06_PHYB8|nr:hypothetical protein PHYBLDRAFT_65588 [Phycomyces blakesleeanus NRRL 1555(-)]OAD72366.1 hypothetical protein PHYBLDRAFT_65588 [Phycomyces blakesleeanus NRRL 1555(-)]|eukprot:XP_018290406.1 hypothetical protein PHYBLDRAFT_65588 [Phycomyces blakesleeanus NRRL 1555(-)]
MYLQLCFIFVSYSYFKQNWFKQKRVDNCFSKIKEININGNHIFNKVNNSSSKPPCAHFLEGALVESIFLVPSKKVFNLLLDLLRTEATVAGTILANGGNGFATSSSLALVIARVVGARVITSTLGEAKGSGRGGRGKGQDGEEGGKDGLLEKHVDEDEDEISFEN